MKKSVMLTVLGLGLVAASTTTYGQGHIAIGNYQGAYNTVVWGPGVPRSGQPVLSAENVVLTLWFGEASNPLMPGPVLPWRTSSEIAGYPGYYDFTTVQLPDWQPGDTYTFQVRASGDSAFGIAFGSSPLWQEMAQITSSVGNPPPLPQLSQQSIGLTVIIPEPSSFALIGLGSAALMIFRRRR
jgi:hypothetical protein